MHITNIKTKLGSSRRGPSDGHSPYTPGMLREKMSTYREHIASFVFYTVVIILKVNKTFDLTFIEIIQLLHVKVKK